MAPANGTIELAGPERIGLDDLVRRYFAAKQDARKVVTDVHARYFGAELNDKSLTPGDNPNIGSTSFETLARSGRSAERFKRKQSHQLRRTRCSHDSSAGFFSQRSP